jgi:cbb3-type cytochrome oxidase maturation protein
MTILLLLIPISLALLGLAVWGFVWAVRRGQFDDLDSAALDILADDHPTRPTTGPGTPSQPTADAQSDAHARRAADTPPRTGASTPPPGLDRASDHAD